MATEELTYLLLGIIILVFLIDFLIKKGRKSKEAEIEKIETNEKKRFSKKGKKYLIVSIITLIFTLSFVIYNNFLEELDEVLYWKTKSLNIYWDSGCSDPDKSKVIDIIKIKFDDDKLLYNLNIHSNSLGINNITEVHCTYKTEKLKNYVFLDKDGFELAYFMPNKLSLRTGTTNYVTTNTNGSKSYRTTNYGNYYNSKGSFYISKKTFKKIKSVEIKN